MAFLFFSGKNSQKNKIRLVFAKYLIYNTCVRNFYILTRRYSLWHTLLTIAAFPAEHVQVSALWAQSLRATDST